MAVHHALAEAAAPELLPHPAVTPPNHIEGHDRAIVQDLEVVVAQVVEGPKRFSVDVDARDARVLEDREEVAVWKGPGPAHELGVERLHGIRKRIREDFVEV